MDEWVTSNLSPRVQYWLDSLPEGKRRIAEYNLSLEGGTQASAHADILAHELEQRVILLESRGIFKEALKVTATSLAAILAAAAAIIGTIYSNPVK